jgi:hypothetical protein
MNRRKPTPGSGCLKHPAQLRGETALTATATHRLGGHDHANGGRGGLWVGSLSCLMDGMYRVLLP